MTKKKNSTSNEIKLNIYLYVKTGLGCLVLLFSSFSVVLTSSGQLLKLQR